MNVGSLTKGSGWDALRIKSMREALEASRAEAAVIVPACDEELQLPRLLDNLSFLVPPADQNCVAMRVTVLVCANNCQDATVGLTRSRGAMIGGLGLRVVEAAYDPPNVGLVRAEAAQAAFEAGCRWVLFTDADVSISHPDFLAVAAGLCDADAGSCFSGWCDEFSDLLRNLPDGTPPAAVELIEFARAFRGRWLPLRDGLFRYTDGANTLVTPLGYEAAGGYEPKPVGGDSTLGDRYLEATGRFPGFFDRPVAPSARKCWAMGRLGGFIFYPLDHSALGKVRSLGPPSRLDNETAFAAAADDLFEFILFVAGKRRSWLEARGFDLAAVGHRVEEAYAAYAADQKAPVSVEFRGGKLLLAADDPALSPRVLPLEWDVVERFWQKGVLA
jgi:hypothetical protein